MPATQLALDQPVHDPSVDITALRSGYDAACLQRIYQAEEHVTALFLGNDGKTPIPELVADQSLAVRCYGLASAHAHLMWEAAKTKDAAYTHKTAQAWWRAVRDALKRTTAPAAEEA